MHQKATYWAKGIRNGFGQIDYPAPEVIKVRWEDKQTLFVNSQGEERLSRSMVYSSVNLDEEGYLMLGESVELNPIELSKAFKIKAISIIPNLRNTKKEIKVWL